MSPKDSGGVVEAHPWISVRGVSKSYGSFAALDNLSFDLPPGIGLLLGDNGAGKSTLVSLLEGLARADGGVIRIAGLDPWSDPRHVCDSVAFLPERPSFFGGARVWEYLDACVAVRGKPAARLQQMVAELGVSDLLSQTSSSLSLGEAQLISLVMVLGSDVRYAVLDEPNAHLDRSRRRILSHVLRRQRNEGRSFLVTTHVIDELLPVADWLIVLRGGRVGEVMALDNLYSGTEGFRILLESRNPVLLQKTLREGGLSCEDSSGTLVIDRCSLYTVFQVLGSSASLVVSAAVYPRGLEGNDGRTS